MSIQQNKEIARRAREELWQGRMELADELFDETCSVEVFDPVTPELGGGPAAIRQLVSLYRAGFPDVRMTVEELVAEDDRVVARWRAEGTHAGDVLGIAATGRRCAASGTDLYRVRDGKIVEYRAHWDTMGLLQQIGALPGAEAAAT